MKKLFILSTSIILLLSFSKPNTSQLYEENCDMSNKEVTFSNNETLSYRVFYNWNFVWVKAGYVNFSIKETTYAGKPSYLFNTVGKTASSYDPIYKVRDYYQSYVDKETLKPIKYIRDTNEGGYTRYQEIKFNHNKGIAESKMGKTKQDTKDETFQIKGCTYDVVSIMYHLRNIDLENYSVGDKIPINILFDDEEYNLYVKYLGDEEVKIKGQGKFNCHKVSPLLVKGGIFTETEQMTVWVTADKNKIPMLIESPIKVGSVKAVLSSAKNIKHPITAKR